MTNTNKLKAKIVENGLTMAMLAEKTNMSKASMSQKINNKFSFSQSDIRAITELLELSGEEIREIFLN